MKAVHLILLVVGLTNGRMRFSRATGGNIVSITSYKNENNYDGSYNFSYESENGISVKEEGSLKNAGQKDLEAQTARGRYSYTAPDGQLISLTWYADETGFHAEGDHIPKSPDLPEAPKSEPPDEATSTPPKCFPGSKDASCPLSSVCFPGSHDLRCPPSCHPSNTDPRCPKTTTTEKPPPRCFPGSPFPESQCHRPVYRGIGMG